MLLGAEVRCEGVKGVNERGYVLKKLVNFSVFFLSLCIFVLKILYKGFGAVLKEE